MNIHRSILKISFALLILSFSASSLRAQALNAGTVTGVVTDPNNAVVPNATVTIGNAVTGYARTINTDAEGAFRFDNVPPNNYQLKAAAPGFSSEQQSLTVRSAVPIVVKIPLAVTNTSETVTVTADATQALENTSTTHTDVDQSRSPGCPSGQLDPVSATW